MTKQIFKHLTQFFESRAIEFVRLRAEATRPGHIIKFSWFDSHELNAFASIEGGDNIGVCTGSLYILKNYFDVALSNAPASIDGDIDRPTVGNLFLHDGSPLNRQLFADGEFLNPIMSVNRHAISLVMLRSAIDFIIFHEIGHIWNGHVDLVNKELGLSKLEELRYDKTGKLGSIDYQTFELDADSFAVPNTLRTADRYRVGPARQDEFLFKSIDEKHGKGASRTVISLAAIYSMFKLINVESWDIADVNNEDHPPAEVRAFYSLNSAARLLMENTTFHEPIGIINAGWALAELLYDSAHNINIQSKIILKIDKDRSSRYTKALLKNWASMRPDLDVLKRGGNLPPIQDITE